VLEGGCGLHPSQSFFDGNVGFYHLVKVARASALNSWRSWAESPLAALPSHVFSTIASNFANELSGPQRSTALGIQQIVMLAELAVNRALDRVDPQT